MRKTEALAKAIARYMASTMIRGHECDEDLVAINDAFNAALHERLLRKLNKKKTELAVDLLTEPKRGIIASPFERAKKFRKFKLPDSVKTKLKRVQLAKMRAEPIAMKSKGE